MTIDPLVLEGEIDLIATDPFGHIDLGSFAGLGDSVIPQSVRLALARFGDLDFHRGDDAQDAFGDFGLLTGLSASFLDRGSSYDGVFIGSGDIENLLTDDASTFSPTEGTSPNSDTIEPHVGPAYDYPNGGLLDGPLVFEMPLSVVGVSDGSPIGGNAGEVGVGKSDNSDNIFSFLGDPASGGGR